MHIHSVAKFKRVFVQGPHRVQWNMCCKQILVLAWKIDLDSKVHRFPTRNILTCMAHALVPSVTVLLPITGELFTGDRPITNMIWKGSEEKNVQASCALCTPKLVATTTYVIWFGCRVDKKSMTSLSVDTSWTCLEAAGRISSDLFPYKLARLDQPQFWIS